MSNVAHSYSQTLSWRLTVFERVKIFYFGFKQHTLVRIAILTAAAVPLPGWSWGSWPGQAAQIFTWVIMKKVWPESCPFRTYLRVQHNIFERFSISLCNKKRRRRKPSWKIQAIWMCHVWQKISLSLLFQGLSNMYFSDEWKKFLK